MPGAGQVANKATTAHPMSVRSLGQVVRPIWLQQSPSFGSLAYRSGPSPASPAASRLAPQAYQYEPAGGDMQSASIEEVEYTPAMANSISLMGNVGKKPELRFFENGNKVASWSLAFTDKRGGETQWFTVEAWGALAEVAAAEIDRGQRIVVEGRLKVESWTTRDTNEQRKTFKIQANAVRKVRLTSQGDSRNQNWQQQQPQQQQQQQQQWSDGSQVPSQPVANYSQSQSNAPAAGSSAGNVTTEEVWMNYFEDPSGWYDNRPAKVAGTINAKSPDFKKKEGGREAPALWIDSRTTPAWVQEELQRQSGGAVAPGQQAYPPF